MLIAARNAIMAGKQLPYDAEVEWLGCDNVVDGTSIYIETDVRLSNNPIIELSVQLTSDATFSWLAGCRRFNSPSVYCNIGINATTRYPRAVYGYGTAQNSSTAMPMHTFNTLRMTHTTMLLNGVSIKTYNGSVGTQFSDGPNFGLFNVIQTGGITPVNIGLSGRMAWCKVWNDDGMTLVGDFVMVRKNGIGCVFNRVSGALLMPSIAGQYSGAFDIGPDK